MIFKAVENNSGSTFIESIHINNISEEAIENLKNSKQHFLPYLYEESFNSVLSGMPSDIQEKVEGIIKSQKKDYEEVDIQSVKSVFDSFVDLFQHVVSVYKKTQDLQKNMNLAKKYIGSSTSKADIAKISNYLISTINKTESSMNSSLVHLKQEYTSMKSYVQSLNDQEVYHSVYNMSYNKEFFYKTLDLDISMIDVDHKLGHGVYFVRFTEEFKKTFDSKKKDSVNGDIEIKLAQKALVAAISSHLRKLDYCGTVDNDLCVVVFKHTTLSLLRNLAETMIESIIKTKMFAVTDFIDIQIGGFFVDSPSFVAEDVIEAFPLLSNKLEDSDKKFIINPFIDYL
jgi:hypothetical protein